MEPVLVNWLVAKPLCPEDYEGKMVVTLLLDMKALRDKLAAFGQSNCAESLGTTILVDLKASSLL